MLTELGERSRYLSYALLLSRSASALRAYQACGELSLDQITKLEQVATHLAHVHRAEQLMTSTSKKIVPDLESVQIYDCVAQALSSTGMLEASASPGLVVTEILSALKALTAGVLPDDNVDLADLERLMDVLSLIYTARAKQSGNPDYLETLYQWSTTVPYLL